jgi:hypothetical protein
MPVHRSIYDALIFDAAEHRVSFTTSCLTVRDYCAVDTVHHVLYRSTSHALVNLLLCVRRREYLIESVRLARYHNRSLILVLHRLRLIALLEIGVGEVPIPVH